MTSIALAALLSMAAVVEESRPVGIFQEVLVRGAFDVDVVVGDKRGVVVTARDAGDVASVVTRVEKGALVLEGGRTDAGIRVLVVQTKAGGLRVSGIGTVRALRLKQKTFSVKHAGDRDVVVTGAFDALDIVLDGAGRVEARDARAKKATVTVNGSGLVEVTADALSAQVNGDGDVRYGGSPAVTRTGTGAGTVEPLGTPRGQSSSSAPSPSRRPHDGRGTGDAERRASDSVRALDPLGR